MSIILASVAAALVLGLGCAVVLLQALSRRGFGRWVGTYWTQRSRRRPPQAGSPVHVLICIADHYEPQHGKMNADGAAARVQAWVTRYPRLFGGFSDSDGRPPRHTFFFPIDEYEASHVDAVAGLCRQGFGELEIHHHHDDDTAAALRGRLLKFKHLFHERHGVLPRDKRTGELMYGFVHGNWALDNSRPDGRRCGVNNELDVLRETGCYADFTLPSFPSPAQTRKINSIYYAVDDPERPLSHDWGTDVGASPKPEDALLLIQGPLVLNWKSRKAGVVPRVENGNLQGSQPPSMERLDLWLRARVQVPQRPDWFFVKLYTHGATETNQAVVLGEPMVRFHEALVRRTTDDPNFHYHYVTAREMYNLVKAAEAGWKGSVADARDFELVWDQAAHRQAGAGAGAGAGTDVGPGVAAGPEKAGVGAARGD